jgi:carbon monoxide dehydrogenase subunit G
MEMLGNRKLGITQQQAWDALNDPETLKKCIPGCDKFDLTGDNQYTVALAVKVGPVSAKFNGKVTLADIMPPDSYKLSFEGQGGVAGFAKGSSSVSLKPVADNGEGCELDYTVQAQVGGKIAQLGQRLIDGAAKSTADDFFKRFEAEMQSRYGPPPPAEAPPAEAIAPPEEKKSAMAGFMQKLGFGKSGNDAEEPEEKPAD